MTLYIDIHEPTEIIDGLKRLVDGVVVAKYDSGDYIFGEIAIERKALTDMLSSLNSKRYFKQVKRLKENYKKPYVLCEGETTSTTLIRKVKEGRRVKKITRMLDPSEISQIRGAQHSTLFSWGVPIIPSTDIEDTIIRIADIYNLEMGYKISKPPSPVVKKSQEVGEIKYLMLNCINGVGPTLAKRVLKVASSFNTLVDIGAEQLAKDIKGLTLDKASLLVEAIK